ncbi:MAG: ankyrin repeat domain-containing protein [Bacteroidales bacterium]|nr:ankyrin repeat domain-containing protein [Bacteroidales bacterium]
MKRTILICYLVVFTVTNSSSQDIFRAVMSGDLNKTKTLLKEQPEWINTTSWGGWTPLHRASQFGYSDIVEFLISKGSHLEARTSLGLTPLYAAIIGQKSEVVKQLIDKGADVFAVRDDGETLLHIAAAMGQKDIVEMLISKGLKIDVTRRYGITPLHLASVFGHKTTVEALISSGAEIDQKNDNGSTALHLAFAAGEAQTVALLKEKGASDAPEEYVKITGEYLGQKKPGSTPELFAPGILLNTHRPHGSIAFSPDGREIYLAAALGNGQFQKIWMMSQHNVQWSPPKAVYFPDSYTYGGPAVSPDGKQFFFDVHKPSGPNGQERDHDIWFQEKNAHGWGDVIKPGPPLNSNKSELGPSVSRNGNVYFYSFDIEGGFGSVDIYYSRFTKGGYEIPENLGDSINTEFMETLPYIAPDESYLLFSSLRPDGHGDFDLYVSYKKKDGTWTKAKNMGDTINTSARESISVVSPDSKYLFFMSRRNGIGEYFWVDAKLINKLKPEGLK